MPFHREILEGLCIRRRRVRPTATNGGEFVKSRYSSGHPNRGVWLALFILMGLPIGVIAQQTPTPTLFTLYNFSGTDGASPDGLVQGRDGLFYGTCQYGGANGNGEIFKIDSQGNFTILYTFSATGNQDGINPQPGLVQGSDGAFYGACAQGGINGNGTLFKINSSGHFSLLHTFAATDTNGFQAEGDSPSGLILATDGFFYGACYQGGTITTGGVVSPGSGVLFKVNAAGGFTVLHTFNGTSDGSSPNGVI